MDKVSALIRYATQSANLTVGGLGVLIFLAGCAVRYLMVCRENQEAVSVGGLLAYTFPAQRLITHSCRVDLIFYVINKFSHHMLVITNIALAVLVSHLLSQDLAVRFGGGGLTPGLFIVAFAYLLAFLPRDLAHYWVHFLHHKVPVLWEFHKVHHAATYLTPLTTERTHPVEDQLFAVAEGLAMGLALGLLRWRYAFSDVQIVLICTFAIWGSRMLVLTPLQHSQVPLHFGPLDRVFYSPSLHQVHHSSEPEHWDRNFGECLSIWDSLFGTYRRLDQTAPKPGLPHGEHSRYMTLIGCYFRPFGQVAERLSASRSTSIHGRRV